MKQIDFLNNFADAIQYHEGWGTYQPNGQWVETVSVKNNNPGNIRFVGQTGVISGLGGFCAAPNFLAGRQLLVHDLELKLAKHDTIRAIISLYAPPTENNTEAYINSVVTWFRKRNFQVTSETSISYFLAHESTKMALIAIDDLFGMADWHSVQSSIDMCAAQMVDFAFSTRYVSRPIGQDDFYINSSPIGNLYAVKEDVTRSILAPLNEGQELNLVLYSAIKQGEAGGVQYGGEAVSFSELKTAFCNALFVGAPFAEITSRAMFHEFIHCLFTLTGVPDYLHVYLVQHTGYAANTITDLKVVYADIANQYKTGVMLVGQAQAVIATATANKNPENNSSIMQLLIAIGNAMAGWLGQKRSNTLQK